MPAKIALVSIKPEYRSYMRVFSKRKWVPVYYPAHADPDISFSASRLHFHIAWNRMSESHRVNSYAADHPVWQWQADEVRVCKKPPKIISRPCVTRRTRWPEIEAMKARL
jgi:hypothetical protein